MRIPQMTAILGLAHGCSMTRERGSQGSSRLTQQVLPAQLGTCYELSGCQGNVEGANVTKIDCFNNLEGASWRGNGTTRCWEN
jgi:hypothetical protein